MAAATALASAAGYVLLLVSGRLLRPADFAVLLAFWGIVFGLGSALSPIEQEVARLSALARSEDRSTSGSAVQVATVGLGIVLLVCLPLMVPAVGRAVLADHASLAPLVALAAAGFVAQFGIRGLLIGHRRIRAYSALVVTEAGLRLAVVAVVVALGIAGLRGLGVAVAAGSAAWLVFAPSARSLVAARADRDPWASVVRRVLALVAAAALTAGVITGYPALVAGLTPGRPDAELGALFAALTVSRVPLLAVSPLQALAVPTVVGLLSRADGRRQVARLINLGLAATLVLAAVGGAAGALVGSAVVRLLYGGKYVVAGSTVCALVVSAVVLAAVLLSCAVLVALRRYGSVTLVWAVVAALAVVVLVLSPGDPSTRAVRGLLVGPCAGLALAALSCRFALRETPQVSPQA